MSLDGIRTVARQEFTQRIRRGRWRWLLAAWFLVTFGFTALLRLGVETLGEAGFGEDPESYRGAVMYGGLMLLVLSLALLVAPALSGQSVNGDRERGVLATLQVTRLRPWEITLGKFAAAWLTSLVFLALTAPLVLWCMAEGGVGIESVLVVTLVMAILLGTVCAVALGLSALLARSTTSGVLSYLAVFALTLGTLIVFGLVTAVTTEKRTVQYDTGLPPSGTAPPPVLEPPPGGLVPPGEGAPVPVQPPQPPGEGAPVPVLPPQPPTQVATYTVNQARPDRTWWLLAPNPFVVLADAAPYRPRCVRPPVDFGPPPPEGGLDRRELFGPACIDTGVDPLGGIGRAVRDLRQRPERCGQEGQPDCGLEFREPTKEKRPAPVWPTGLAVDLGLAVGGLALTARRLRTPTRTLATGQRVA